MAYSEGALAALAATGSAPQRPKEMNHMAMTLPTANKGGDAPEVADGLALVRLEDILLKEHPDWVAKSGGVDKFGKPDNGDRFHFVTTLVDDKTREPVPYTVKGEVQYDDEGDPKEVRLELVTRTATGEKSNFATKGMSGVLTAKEFAAWQAADESEPLQVDLKGRFLHAKIVHNDGGWPQIESIVGVAK